MDRWVKMLVYTCSRNIEFCYATMVDNLSTLSFPCHIVSVTTSSFDGQVSKLDVNHVNHGGFSFWTSWRWCATWGANDADFVGVGLYESMTSGDRNNSSVSLSNVGAFRMYFIWYSFRLTLKPCVCKFLRTCWVVCTPLLVTQFAPKASSWGHSSRLI